MRAAPLAAIGLLLALDGATALGAPVTSCGAPGRSWIKVSSPDASFVDSFRAEVTAEGFDACAQGGPVLPVATVSVGVREAVATIEVVDGVTSKRVSRDVDLGSIPADGRVLALAVAADELVQASWAELALAKAPPPSAPVPDPVRRVVESSVRPVAAPSAEPSGVLGVMLAGEAFSGGQTLWGADVRMEWLVTPHYAATLRLGLRSGLPRQAVEGEVHASAILGGLGVAWRVAPSGRVGLDLFARLDVADVTYLADTTINARASSGSAAALLASAGGQVAFRIVPALRLTAEVGAIAPLRAVRATEAQTDVVVGVTGVGALAGIGAGGFF